MRTDEYGEVVNHLDTYDGICQWLRENGSVIIGWTDQHGTHLDILFSRTLLQYGNLQRGMSAYTDMFVAVSGFGMFGFDIKCTDSHAGYVGEKLGLGGVNSTTEALAELINEVRGRL